jgi:selenocysteine lyase/cysteine desulfurase
VHTPLDTDDLAAVTLFSVDGVDARALERELREVHRVHVKYRQVRQLQGLRVSPHVYTTEAELERFVQALEQAVRRSS